MDEAANEEDHIEHVEEAKIDAEAKPDAPAAATDSTLAVAPAANNVTAPAAPATEEGVKPTINLESKPLDNELYKQEAINSMRMGRS